MLQVILFIAVNIVAQQLIIVIMKEQKVENTGGFTNHSAMAMLYIARTESTTVQNARRR